MSHKRSESLLSLGTFVISEASSRAGDDTTRLENFRQQFSGARGDPG